MRTISLVIVAVSSFAIATAADPVVPVPVPVDPPSYPKWIELKTQPGRQITIGTGGIAAKWLPVDDNCDLTPATDGKTATFSAPIAGHYRIVCVINGEPSRLLITVGDPPAPPNPGPGPGPGPAPTPPAPADPLPGKLKAAFDVEASPTKKEQIKDLAALYRQASALANDYTMVKDANGATQKVYTVSTSGQLLARVQAASKTLVGSDALKGVRAVAAAELGALLPVDATLSDGQRTAAAALFKKLATVLEGF